MKTLVMAGTLLRVTCVGLLFGTVVSASAENNAMSPMAAVAAGEQPTSPTQADNTRLISAVILSRHGTRSLLKDNATLERETANKWPTWDVPPGYLTSRGRKQMVDMGSYYRARFTREGLLTGND